MSLIVGDVSRPAGTCRFLWVTCHAWCDHVACFGCSVTPWRDRWVRCRALTGHAAWSVFGILLTAFSQLYDRSWHAFDSSLMVSWWISVSLCQTSDGSSVDLLKSVHTPLIYFNTYKTTLQVIMRLRGMGGTGGEQGERGKQVIGTKQHRTRTNNAQNSKARLGKQYKP